MFYHWFRFLFLLMHRCRPIEKLVWFKMSSPNALVVFLFSTSSCYRFYFLHHSGTQRIPRWMQSKLIYDWAFGCLMRTTVRNNADTMCVKIASMNINTDCCWTFTGPIVWYLTIVFQPFHGDLLELILIDDCDCELYTRKRCAHNNS